MRSLSKSKLIAYRQCPKRLWLEIHHPELAEYSAATKKAFSIGHQVGAIAQKLYDPSGSGTLLDAQTEGYDTVFNRTRELIHSATPAPIFEAGFTANGALAFADIMLPTQGSKVWRMIEVKAATKLKDYYLEDTAIQTYVAIQSGVNLEGVSVALIDSQWVYPGNGDYRGLLKTEDVTGEAFKRHPEVTRWIKEAQTIADQPTEPEIKPGKQCTNPNPCGFIAYCTRNLETVEYPLTWLPRLHQSKIDTLEALEIFDLRDVPDKYLTDTQKLVRDCTIKQKRFFELDKTQASLSKHPYPAYFLDFETSNMAIPIWAGTRPYEQSPFQYSLHIYDAQRSLSHEKFIDLSGNDPTRAFAEKLIKDCGSQGPIFVYNASFESGVIRRLAERYEDLNAPLLAINERLVDLQPLAKDHHYHPKQKGSWSIKELLPTIDSTLDYSKLEGVQHGQMAIDAYAEAVHPATSADRKSEIERQLLDYCELDTLAMVRVWEAFTGLRPLE